ncbi:MAG: NAD(P)/FAD-dependent oxidoreductase [Verrucomicrobia bacterium]|nr:NAD(P)/FAD-dependent oxidoreductase [Verrucomicrobiota bacterium]
MKESRIARRTFLLKLAAVSLGVPMTGRGALRPGTRVIVIGAGVSGLAAAKSLHEAGATITVLEARNRIGGRIHTDRTTFEVPVEIGAQYVQGTKSDDGNVNPVWKMAQEQGWKSVAFATESAQLVRDGEAVDAEALTEGMEEFMAFLEEMDTEDSDSVEVAVRKFISEFELDAGEIADLRAMIASEVGLEYAGDIHAISIEGAGEAGGYGGGNHILTGGYDQVPNLLAAGLPNLRLEEVVTAVDYSGALCTVTTEKGTYQADYVICSLPLGVLQAESVRFTPALPSAKSKAIGRMGMGQLGKVILQFPERFWPKDVNWFLSLKLSPPWGIAFSNLDRVTPDHHLLVMWHSGTLAKERESLDDATIVKIALAELRAAVGESIPAPTRTLVTRWGSDPFSRGAYFFPKVGSTLGDVDELGKPYNRKRHKKGEATHAELFATVPGAIISGQREAKRIIHLASV